MSERVAFFDVDQTLVSDFSGTSFLEFAAQEGLFDQEQLSTLLEARGNYEEGRLDYKQASEAWGKTIAKGLKGKRQADIQQLTAQFWEVIEPKFAPWAKDLVSLFNEKGFLTVAISGSNEELLNLYQEKLGFDRVFATQLEVNNGIYTGKLLKNLVLDEAKREVVLGISREHVLDLESSYGFGDSEHDRAFLDKVGNPVAINPGKQLRQYAAEHGWLIFNFNDSVAEEIQKALEQ